MRFSSLVANDNTDKLLEQDNLFLEKMFIQPYDLDCDKIRPERHEGSVEVQVARYFYIMRYRWLKKSKKHKIQE